MATTRMNLVGKVSGLVSRRISSVSFWGNIQSSCPCRYLSSTSSAGKRLEADEGNEGKVNLWTEEIPNMSTCRMAYDCQSEVIPHPRPVSPRTSCHLSLVLFNTGCM